MIIFIIFFNFTIMQTNNNYSLDIHVDSKYDNLHKACLLLRHIEDFMATAEKMLIEKSTSGEDVEHALCQVCFLF